MNSEGICEICNGECEYCPQDGCLECENDQCTQCIDKWTDLVNGECVCQ